MNNRAIFTVKPWWLGDCPLKQPLMFPRLVSVDRLVDHTHLVWASDLGAKPAKNSQKSKSGMRIMMTTISLFFENVPPKKSRSTRKFFSRNQTPRQHVIRTATLTAQNVIPFSLWVGNRLPSLCILIEGSLEVKLPAIWTHGEHTWKRIRKKEDEGARKGRTVAKRVRSGMSKKYTPL